MSAKKLKFCKAVIKSPNCNGTIFFADVFDALTALRYDLGEEEEDDPNEVGDKITIKLEVVEMTQREYDAMPEFDGF